MRARFGAAVPLLLIMGSDAFDGLPSWHQWQRLLMLAHIVVMTRPGDFPSGDRFPPGYVAEHTVETVADLRKQAAGSILRVPVTQLDISATKIRQALEQGKSVRYLLPDILIGHIHSRHLYS
jgi:nicotinate-nucleotide adenylyltransferase